MMLTRNALFFGLSLMASACASNDDVLHVTNVERAVTTWRVKELRESDEGATDAKRRRAQRIHLCLEYASPAEKLEATKASLAVPVGADKNVSVSYESAQSLATIYSVSEIMQFGHAALYRLCEASGNRAISNATYRDLFGQTLQNVNELLRLQMLQVREGVDGQIAVLRAQVQSVDSQICVQRRLGSTAVPSQDFDTQRKAFVARHTKLVPAATQIVAPLPDPVPATTEFDTAAGLVKAVNQANKDAKDAKDGKDREKAKAQLKAACSNLRDFSKKYESNSCNPVQFRDLDACPGD
jgi:hypothetical protein